MKICRFYKFKIYRWYSIMSLIKIIIIFYTWFLCDKSKINIYLLKIGKKMFFSHTFIPGVAYISVISTHPNHHLFPSVLNVRQSLPHIGINIMSRCSFRHLLERKSFQRILNIASTCFSWLWLSAFIYFFL